MGFKEKLQKNSHKSREKKLRQEAEKIHGELYIFYGRLQRMAAAIFCAQIKGAAQQKPPFKRDIE